MSPIDRFSTRITRRTISLLLFPALIECASDSSTGTIETPPPGAVSDLVVSASTPTSVSLTFTQVADGTGNAASYDVRYAPAPMSWGAATSATNGSCTTPVAGTGVGSVLSCSVLGLSPATPYDFQVVAFRGTLNNGAVYGQTSNVASATTPAPPPVVTTVTVTPSIASVVVAATISLQATVKDAQGSDMSGQVISWSSDNSSVASVSAAGVVTGMAAGSATITATCAGKSGTASITVNTNPPVVTTVTVSPPSASISVGGTVALGATVKDEQGAVMPGQTVSWSSNNTGVATVSSSGLVSGVTAGSATITATAGGKAGTASVTVTSAPPPAPVVTTVTVAPLTTSVVAGTTVALTATVRDQVGNVMTGQTVTWSTSNPSAASVNTTGVVTGVAAGSATITASCAGKTGSSAVTVTAPPSGGTLLLQENFEDANLASRGWYDNTSVLLSTTEHIAGSNSSAQYHYLAGAQTPTTGGAQRHKFTPTSSLYISFYVKYSTNWVGSGQAYHPHEFYAMSNLDGDSDGPSNAYMTIYLEHNYQNGGKPAMYIQDNKSINTTMGALPNNLVGVTENRSTSGCNGIPESVPWSVVNCYNAPPWYNAKGMVGPVAFQPNAGAGYKNNWNFVEAYYQLNTIANGVGQPDGVLQYWFNGTLLIDRHDVVFRTAARPTIQFSQFLIAPYIGDGSPVDQSMFIDNLRIATARIP